MNIHKVLDVLLFVLLLCLCIYSVQGEFIFFIFDIMESSVNPQLEPAYHGLIKCDVRSKFNDVNMRKSPCNNSKIKQ